ncbi:MAG: glycosyltransferase family 1 protein [Patescibacteria group bacterium]
MIIGIDASRANLKHKTGTEWYSFYLIKNLAEIDKVNIYWLYLNQPPREDLITAVKNNPNFSFKLLNWPFFTFWTLGRLTLEMLYRRPDVLFIPAHALPLFGPRKTVNTIHDLAFIREKNLYHSFKVKTHSQFFSRIINFFVRLVTLGRYRSGSLDYLYWSTNFALHHAKKIIAVSQSTRREILSQYPKTPADKIITVLNGYNQELFKKIDNPEKTKAVLERYGLDEPYFLYIGRLEKKKNTVKLIEAFALLKEKYPQIKEKLVLIGCAGFGYDQVSYTIHEFDVSRQVLMPGWVAEEDLPYILNRASAFVFPSKYEGFGIPVLQALACGVPAVVSDIPVLREIGADAVSYFDPNDKKSMAESLAAIILNQELREKLIARGLIISQQYSWRRCASETLEVIKAL